MSADAIAARGGRRWRVQPALMLGIGVLVAILAVTILYPMVWSLLGSFQTEEGDWTLAHYQRVFTPYYLRVMGTTILYAVSTVAVSLAIGVPMAWAVARTDMPGRHFLRGAVMITFVMPPLFHALAFVFLFQPRAGLVNDLVEQAFGVRPFNIYSLPGLVAATAAGLFPQAFLLVDAALRSVDPALEEAAAVAGASQIRILRRILLPVILPAIVSAAILGVIETLAVFGPPAVIGIPAKIFVMSTQIFIELSGSPPRIEFCAALAVLFLAVAAILLLVQDRLVRRRSFATITGKGFRPRQIRLGRWKWLAAGLCLLVVAGALFVPVVVLVVISISKVWTAGLTPGNLTLRFYGAALLGTERTFQSLANTLLLSLTTVFTTFVVGLPIAWIVTQHRGWIARVIRLATYLPFSVPAVVFTVGVVLAFIRPPLVLYGTLAIVAICYFGRFLPFAVQPLSDALRQIDLSLVEAARIVGSGMGRITLRILLPLLRFAAVSTAMLVFVACVREIVSIALLYSPGTETLMMTTMLLWQEGQVQVTAAMVVLTLVLVVVFYGAARLATRSRIA